MNEFFKIGLIVKPQGIKGEVKVMPLTDSTERFRALKEVLIDNVKHKIISAKIAPDSVILAISGITDRNTAETFRGKFLVVPREDAVELEEGEFFIADVIGCTLKTEDGSVVGTIIDATSAKTDYFTVKLVNEKIMRFPFLKDLLVYGDMEKGEMVVKAKRLSEVACYED